MVADQDVLTIILRTMVYAGTVAASGSVVFALIFPEAKRVIARTLKTQMLIGALLVLFAEPARYILFQLAIAAGDWTLAFTPEMRWMAFEVSTGQAAIARLAAVVIIVAAGLRILPLAAGGAALAIFSYSLEGHTAASEVPGWLPPLLLMHVAIVHCWIGGLWPLAAMMHAPVDRRSVVDRFGRIALPFVLLLIAAGVLVLAVMSNWTIDFNDAYLQLGIAKIVAVGAVLAVAAFNKFKVTPQFTTRPDAAAPTLRVAVKLEAAFALLVLIVTALLVTTSPGMNH